MARSSEKTFQSNAGRSSKSSGKTPPVSESKSARAITKPQSRISARFLLTTADDIKAECAVQFAANSDDCNKFIKAVAKRFFEPDLFTGSSMDADGIIAEMDGSTDWNNLQKDHTRAISEAVGGKFVIAGMTSGELGDSHGHLAVVVGDPGQVSGTVIVPICYAGSLKVSARVQRKRVSETFGAQYARDGDIRYYARATQTSLTGSVIDRLIEYLRGVRDGD